jgi:hypothetical protein
MSLPTLVKTYQFVNASAVSTVNIAIPAAVDASTTCRNVMWRMVTEMISFASNPWTVVGSSNSIAAGMDAVNRWVTAANVVGAPGAHSWIVLYQAATGLYRTYDMLVAAMNTATIVDSYVLPTGGSTTARPTSTVESVRISSAAWGGLSTSTNNNCVLNVVMSTDGLNTFVWTNAINVCTGLHMMCRPTTPANAWLNPVVTYTLAGTIESQVCSNANVITSGTPSFSARGNGIMTVFGLVKASSSAPVPTLFTSVSDLDHDATFATSTSCTFNAAGQTIVRAAGNWATDGAAVGKLCYVSGTASNNGVKGLITVVTPLTLTVTSGVVNEGSVAANVVGGNGTLPFVDIHVGSLTALNRGVHGQLVDVYLNLATPGTTGDAFPVTGNREWTLVGDVLLPWTNQAAALVA